MDIIKQVIAYVQENWLDICAIITSVIGTASIIVKLTPSKKDDKILAKVKAFVSKYIALN